MEELISEELESRYYGTTSVLKTVDEIESKHFCRSEADLGAWLQAITTTLPPPPGRCNLLTFLLLQAELIDYSSSPN